MKIIVTHNSPDWDAITSVWLLKTFLSGWHDANVQFVPAGERLHPVNTKRNGASFKDKNQQAIENIDGADIIHVDTGLGPLDHHQIYDTTISAASRVWEFVQAHNPDFLPPTSQKMIDRKEAIDRIVEVVVAIDHFKELFWDNPTADYHEFSLLGVLEGYKLMKLGDDKKCMDFGIECLNALLHTFENRIWAEKEIATNGHVFKTKWGKGLAIETINDTVLKLAQKSGFMIVVRKDPRKGYVRIKARPQQGNEKNKNDIDLTLVYEQLKKMDPDATWFLHVSKKMLLNGTAKNPKMVPTKLSLQEIIRVLKEI